MASEWRTEELVGGNWVVLCNGWQQGGPTDPSLGCGTKEFATEQEAMDALMAWRDEEESAEQRYLRHSMA